MSYAIGDRFWVPDDDHAWLAGTLKEFKNSVLEFNTEKGVKKFRVADLKSKLEGCGSHLDDNVENLVDLDELSEGAILHHVRNRFGKRVIYTHVGSILVAVNPFENLPIYSERDIRRAYESTHPYPHVFVTSATAYQQLCNNYKNQSVLISGESGAGKTETTKKVLTFLANIAPDSKPKAAGEPGMETKILQSNPLLEALGNAKTLRNNNSSRFGKWMKVGFDPSFRIQGCEIVNYLLEKSRVVGQSTNERNYHIFYQILAGADASMRTRLHLKTPADYHYLNQSGCIKIDGVDDAAEFRDVLEAMSILQFSNSTCESMFKVLAGILLLGNVQLEEGEKGAGTSRIAHGSLDLLLKCSELFGINLEAFQFSLTQKKISMGRGSIVNVQLSADAAMTMRDTLSKALYSNMFDWVIGRVNNTLKTVESPYSIGILDIFGFEVFELNSFEQMCINYANEKLQFHFNEVIFNLETLMYQEEGISLEKVNFEDNGDCVGLIEGKPYGLLALLDDECSLGESGLDIGFINKVEKTFGTGKPNANKYFIKNKVKPEYFSVCHFAGAVEYCVTSFLDKNRDTMSISMREVMEQSQIPLVADLFVQKEEPAAASAPAKRGGKSAATKSTLGGQFRNQLIGLVTNLRTTEPHFIRCVKPNHQKVGGIFDGNLALRQLRYAGLFEAIRIRKSGYAYRATFKNFANTFQILVDGLSLKRQNKSVDDKEACRLILTQTSVENLIEREFWVIGTSKVFLKANSHRTVLERQKVARVTVFAVRIQVAARAFVERMKANKVKYEMIKERKRIEAEQLKLFKAATGIQKNWRRKLVRNMMKSMQNLIELRRVLAKREIGRIREVLMKIDNSNKAQGGGSNETNALLHSMFQHEIRIAKVMLQLIQIQDQLVVEIQKALDNSDVAELNRLLVKSERLEMTTHPIVLQAKEELVRLNKKHRVLKKLIAFLRNADEFTDTIVETIEEARFYQIDDDFISKVQRVHESAGPRLKARNRLRTAIEFLDRFNIEQNCIEVLGIQKMQPGFAESEMRAAKAMLRLLNFDRQLNDDEEGEKSEAKSEDDEGGEKQPNPLGITSLWGVPILDKPSGALLTKDLVEICNGIVYTKNPFANKVERKKLQVACGSVQRYYDVIRYYKWSKTVCSWKYPETQMRKSLIGEEDELHAHRYDTTEEQEFYGLRPLEARTATYIIRTLHKDFDVATGTGTPLMQAAMGTVELPSSISATLQNLDELNNIDVSIKLPNGETFKKTVNHATKKALTTTHSSASVKAASSTPSPSSASKKLVMKGAMPVVPIKRVENLSSNNLEKKLLESRTNKARQFEKVVHDLDQVKRNIHKGWK